MITMDEHEKWLDYIDKQKPTDEDGYPQLSDDTPEEIVEEYQKYIEWRNMFL